MENDVEFAIKLKGNNLVFEETSIKIMNLLEASEEVRGLRAQLTKLKDLKEQSVQQIKDNVLKNIKQLEQQIKNLRNNLDEKKIRKMLNKTSMDFEKLIPVERKWSKDIKEFENNIKRKLKLKIREAKKIDEYDKIENREVQIVRQNAILAPLCVEFKIDRAHPIVIELAKQFEKI